MNERIPTDSWDSLREDEQGAERSGRDGRFAGHNYFVRQAIGEYMQGGGWQAH